MKRPLLLSLALTLGCLPAVTASAQMMGRQSHNTGIRAVPAPATVTIDGDLAEWDFSGRIWSFADLAIRDRYSAETAVMWDKDYVYLALKVRDPNPLNNTVNPAFNPEKGWQGDSLQLRLLTDWPQWITFWNYTNESLPVMHQAVWPTPTNSRETDMTVTLRTGKPGSSDLGDGVQLAYKADADGRGYVQETRIPWGLIYKKAPVVAPGLTFRIGLEFFWGTAGETLWPAHRYADNLQIGETSREFFWKGTKLWGDVTLLDHGNVEPLVYSPPTQKIQGTIPVRAIIPADAREFTIVIETPDGERVRNLGAQLDGEQYSVSITGDERTVEVLWDGLDDAGKLASGGTYHVRGLTQSGLGADYVMSFFNPGNPPWEAGPGSSWGADHTCPKFTAAAGDWTILGWPGVEGGHGVIGIGPDGNKIWGEKRGTQALTADTASVYFVADTAPVLCRLVRDTGAYQPFIADGKELPFEYPLVDLFGGKESIPGKPTGIASSGKTLALAFSGGKIVLLDSQSAQLLKTLDVPAPTAIAYGAAGELYAVSAQKLVQINPETGARRVIPTPGVTPDRTLAIDPQGNLGLYDNGPDQQVKFFSPSGKPEYTAGLKGGRPIRGDFVPAAMRHVSSVSVDTQGQVWAVENWEYPRRVSVWGRDGKLIRDYIGNTTYAGSGAYLHDNDPTLAYYGPVEMKLDLAKKTWTVTRILWVPGEGEQFELRTQHDHNYTHPHRFTSEAGGKRREFLFQPAGRPYESYVLYMEDDKGWRPVSAIGLLGQLSGKLDRTGKVVAQPDGEYAGHNACDGYFWNDLNTDGRVQFNEVVIVPISKPVAIGKSANRDHYPIPWGSGWGTRMSPADLSFAVNGPARYIPLRYTAEGAPVFGPDSIKKLSQSNDRGDFVPVSDEKSVLVLSDRIAAIDQETGRTLWSYPNPYPSVHGSHRAPMPRPGLVIGPLKFLGVADLPDNGGHVFGLRGNLGQDFFFTTDGLLIGSLFQDGRLPTIALPAKESDLNGVPMETFSGGGEPFSGWFGSHSDGKTRLTSGLPRQAAMILEVSGFDRVKRFTAAPFQVTDATLSQAAIANDERLAAAALKSEKKETIVRLAQAPAIDGKGTGWKPVPTFVIESSSSNVKAKAALAYDATHLYLAMDVEDSSPWVNEGVDFTRLFKTGDAVDIQLGLDPKASAKRTQPVAGDLRIVFASLAGKPAAVLMRPVNPAAPKSSRKVYQSPVGPKAFDEVRQLADSKVVVVKTSRGYRLEAAVPLISLGLAPQAGSEISGDIGFISSDSAGRINTARTYWANQATNLVNDEPQESWLFPASWGVFVWGE